MTARRVSRVRTGLAVAFVLLAAAVVSVSPVASEPDHAIAVASHDGVVREHQYRMSGRIRPLLIWMGRDDVGLARVVWREDGLGGRGYDLLIGTDPARAPRRLNRWGFVAERGTAGAGDVLALMSGAIVGSFAEASADATTGSSGARLQLLRGRLAAGVTEGRLSQLSFAEAPTVHDLDEVLARVPYEGTASQRTSGAARADARPGLLTAIADLLAELVAAAQASTASLDAASKHVVPYTFGRESYELRVRSARLAKRPGPGNVLVRALDTELEIVTASTGARTRFELASGVDGSLARVPLLVRWQPRWWLEVALHLQN
jgi:hypothetical protein